MLARLPITTTAPLLSVMWNRQLEEAIIEIAEQNIKQIHILAATKVVDVILNIISSPVEAEAQSSLTLPTARRQPSTRPSRSLSPICGVKLASSCQPLEISSRESTTPAPSAAR